MTPIITGGSSPVIGAEELTLGGLELHTAPFTVEAFDHVPSKKLLEWIRSADSNGAKLLRLPKHETATVQLRLRVDQQADMDTALLKIGEIVDRVQEAERQAAGGRGRGLELVWSPAGSTFTGTFYVQAGEVEVPKTTSGQDVGYLWRFPVINMTLTCDPFIYGDEVTTSTTTSSAPLVLMTVEDVPGDVPAEARIIVTDGATQSRDFVAVGVENFYYGAGPALLIDSASMVTSGFAGSTTTRTGGYSSDGVIRATLSTTPVTVCSSAELTHIGTFRNRFRLWPSSTGVTVRLAWRQGRDAWTTEPWQTAPFEDAFWEPDLGQTKIRPVAQGTQSWQWRIEAKSTTAGDTIDVDMHQMLPCDEGYGQGRATPTFETATAFTARDEFAHSAGALTGKVAPSGQTWTVLATSDGDDFNMNTGTSIADRVATSDSGLYTGRYVTAGTTAYGALAVQVDVQLPRSENVGAGLIHRAVAMADQFQVALSAVSGYTDRRLFIRKRVASTTTELGGIGGFSVSTDQSSTSWFTIRLQIVGARYWVWFGPQGREPTLIQQGTDTDLSGTLATGKIGVFGVNVAAAAATVGVDNFMAFVPAADTVCYSGQSCEFRSYGDDPILREDSTGTYWGRPPESRGGRIELPPAGDEDRTSRIAVIARRNDIDTLSSGNIADSTSVAVAYRPRWAVVPRQA